MKLIQYGIITFKLLEDGSALRVATIAHIQMTLGISLFCFNSNTH